MRIIVYKLRDLELVICEALRADDLNGYDVFRQVFFRARELVRGKHGLLYPALYRLMHYRYVEAYIRIEAGRKCKYFKLTARGRKKHLKIEK